MKILLLAGSGDARRIASALVNLPNIDLTASLAGATRQPADLPCETRIGGFGGADAFLQYLQQEGFDAVVDATHPFAARISQRSAQICQQHGVPFLQMLRPAWRAAEGDNWTEVGDETKVADHIPKGATVFLATGRQTLPGFANMEGRHLICRQIDPPDGPFPFENGEFLVGRPPFSVNDEENLFCKLGVDWLVVKNSGGQAPYSKLTAARNLNMPVVMIARPEQPKCDRATKLDEVLAWVAAL